MNKAVFFDRDGVLNVEVDYLWQIERFHWMDGAREAVKLCNDKNYLAIVITNQGGIARGLYTHADVDNLHKFMQDELNEIGAHIDAFYYCPHHPKGIIAPYNEICECRKPKPGMILQACKDFNIDPAQSIMFGDTQRDLDAANNAGLREAILFREGNLFDAVKIHLDNK